MYEVTQIGYDDAISWLKALGGKRIAVSVDDPETAGLTSFTGWFVGAIDGGRDGVWFSVRDGSDLQR